MTNETSRLLVTDPIGHAERVVVQVELLGKVEGHVVGTPAAEVVTLPKGGLVLLDEEALRLTAEAVG